MSVHFHVVTSGRKGSVQYADAGDAGAAARAMAEARLAEEAARGLPGRLRGLHDGWQVRYGDEYLHGEPAFTVTGCTDSHEDDAVPSTVMVEVWPLSAHEDGPEGIWLLSGIGPWTAGPVSGESDPHEAVERLLAAHDALEPAFLLHSTSWRAEGSSVILTYVAAISCPHVLTHWRNCQPVDGMLPELVGPPITHGAADVPVNRESDVLLHGLRHLRFLMDHSATEAAAMSPAWKRALCAFTPALAGMYAREHRPEVLPQAS